MCRQGLCGRLRSGARHDGTAKPERGNPMYTNLYLVEKLDSAHRADMLREAAHDRRASGLHRAQAHLGWRAAGALGALLVRVGGWLERSAQRSGRMVMDA